MNETNDSPNVWVASLPDGEVSTGQLGFTSQGYSTLWDHALAAFGVQKPPKIGGRYRFKNGSGILIKEQNEDENPDQAEEIRQLAMTAAADWKVEKEKDYAALMHDAGWSASSFVKPAVDYRIERMVAYLLHEREEEKKLRPLENEIADLLDRHSVGDQSDTPNWILAQFLRNCLQTWTTAITARNASIQGRRGDVG